MGALPESGTTDYNQSGLNKGHGVLVHSDGTLATVVMHDDGFQVLTSADRGATWTQRVMITTYSDTRRNLSLAQFVNGDIVIVARNWDRNQLQYCKVTWGTWAASAWEIIATGTNIESFDVDVSDAGAVGVAFHHDPSTNMYLILQVRKPAGGWVQSFKELQYSGKTRKDAGECVSVCALNISSGVRTWIIASGLLTTATDYGLDLFRAKVTESTSVAVGAFTQDLGAISVAGTIKGTTPWNTQYRAVRQYRTGPDEFATLLFNRKNNPTSSAEFISRTVGVTPTGSTLVRYTSSAMAASDVSILGSTDSSVAFTADANRNYGFHYSVQGGSGTLLPRIMTHVHADDGTVQTGMVHFASSAVAVVWGMASGTKRNLDQSEHEFFYEYVGPNWNAFVTTEAVPNPGGLSAIKTLTPADLAQEQPANPNLSAAADINTKYSQSAYRIEFEFATDLSFTTNLNTFRQAKVDSKKIEGTDAAGVVTSFTTTLPGSYNLPKAVWYYRARLVDIYDNTGLWTPVQTFSVGHPPSAVPTSPTGGGFYNWNAGVRTFSWTFYDPSPTDYQTAYHVVVKDELGAVVLDTGKTLSSDKFVTLTIPIANKDEDLTWTVQLWDSDDAMGFLSPMQWFNLTDMPTAVISAPTANQVLATGVPTIVFTPSTGGGRGIKEYSIIITQGPNLIWTQRFPTPGLASGVEQSVKLPQGFLENNSNYSVQASIVDTADLQGQSSVVSFSTAWIPPASPTGVVVSTVQYNVEDEGYILVTWDDLAREVDEFTSWSLLRKDDLVDPLTGFVVEEGTWNLLHREFSVASEYEYRDFFAPANYEVTYRVIQSVNRDGQDIDSLPTDAEGVVPISDGYWLIEPTSLDVDADAFKLSLVVGDSFTEEQEEAEFTVIGRGRIVNKGQRLGNKGTLDVQLRNTGGTSARQKRLRLIEAQRNTRQMWLRNPFGDIFKVSVSAMSISRIAGVGGSEFCDVTIPYSEVS